MKTVVYQSFRADNIPGWISQCLETVKKWAEQKGFIYRFIDNRISEHVPDWYLSKLQGNMLPVFDLARLELAKLFLDEGYDRTIWVDADIVVFDSDNFDIDVKEEFAFCLEVWLYKNRIGRPVCIKKVNNAVTVFTRNNHMLEFYIYACKSLVRNKNIISKTEVGTKFLTELYRNMHFQLLNNIGIFSPALLYEIATGREKCVRKYITEFGHPIRAANLCYSFRNLTYRGALMSDKIYQTVIDKLIESKGNIVNKYL